MTKTENWEHNVLRQFKVAKQNVFVKVSYTIGTVATMMQLIYL